jgi:hypothetical protein
MVLSDDSGVTIVKDKILTWVFTIVKTTAMPLIVSLTEKSPQWKLLIICVVITYDFHIYCRIVGICEERVGYRTLCEIVQKFP